FALLLLSAVGGADTPIVETTNASLDPWDGEKLRVVFAPEGRPAVVFKPGADAWDWSATSKLSIPVENPGDEALTVLLRIESASAGSLTGKTSIAAHSAGDLVIWISAPSPRAMGMIAGPPTAAAGGGSALPVTATEGSV